MNERRSVFVVSCNSLPTRRFTQGDRQTMESNQERLDESDQELLARFSSVSKTLIERLKRQIVGQDAVLEEILAAFFAGGHLLLTGAPGLGKTHIARSIAAALELKFNRVQFTPDLTPSDVLGSNVLQESPTTGERSFEFMPGPIFTNVLLADELNRTPPKTQAALLEAMQERQVTLSGKRYELEEPFFVLATTNPIEYEGTYVLPESQLDRFLFSAKIDYPKAAAETEMVLMTTGERRPPEKPLLSLEDVLRFQALVRRVPLPVRIAEHAAALARKTRPQLKSSSELTQKYVEQGAGPRASQAIALGAKSFAAAAGRPVVSVEDVERAAPLALRSRIVLNYLAQGDGIDVDLLVRKIIREVGAERE